MKSWIEWVLCNLQVKKLVEGNGGALLSNFYVDSRDDVIHLAKPTEISLRRWDASCTVTDIKSGYLFNLMRCTVKLPNFSIMQFNL
jgi:hypothetical protein